MSSKLGDGKIPRSLISSNPHNRISSGSKNLQENTYARVSFSINFIKKETLAQVFSCEFFEIFKNAFFYQNTPGGYF